jgi:hypothetical protein
MSCFRGRRRFAGSILCGIFGEQNCKNCAGTDFYPGVSPVGVIPLVLVFRSVPAEGQKSEAC